MWSCSEPPSLIRCSEVIKDLLPDAVIYQVSLDIAPTSSGLSCCARVNLTRPSSNVAHSSLDTCLVEV
jgi:hypothetical protein